MYLIQQITTAYYLRVLIREYTLQKLSVALKKVVVEEKLSEIKENCV